MSGDEQIYDFRAAFEAVRRRALLVFGLALLAAAAAAIVTAAQSERYEATSVLLFRDPGLDPSIVGRPNLLGGEQIFDADTNVGLAELDSVAEYVARNGEPELSAAEVAEAVEVGEGAGPELVEITAEAGDPELAALIANSYAGAFVELRRDVDRATVRRALDEASAELASLDVAEREGPGGQELLERIGDLRALELLQTGDAEVVAQAGPPTSSTSGSVVRNGLVGGITGLLIGLVTALLLQRFDPRLRSAREIGDAFAVPVLASIPAGGGGQDVEALRCLAAALRYMDRERSVRCVLLMPSGADPGAGRVAADLARVSSADGFSVALLEADLRRPALGTSMSLEPGSGLAELLAGEARLDEASREIDLAGTGGSLIVIPAGGSVAAPAALLGSSRLTDAIEELRERHDLVLISAPSLGEVSDALPLLNAVDAVVVVCGSGEDRAAAVELRRRLDEFGAPLLGVVADRIDGA